MERVDSARSLGSARPGDSVRATANDSVRTRILKRRLSFRPSQLESCRSPLHYMMPGEESDLADIDATSTAATHVSILNAMRGRGEAQGVVSDGSPRPSPYASARRASKASLRSMRRAIWCYHVRHGGPFETLVSLALLCYLFVLPQYERTTGLTCRPFKHGRLALGGVAVACVGVLGVDFGFGATVVGWKKGLAQHKWLLLYGGLLAVFFVDEVASLAFNWYWAGAGGSKHGACRSTVSFRLLLLLCRLRHVRGACSDVLKTLPHLCAPLVLVAIHVIAFAFVGHLLLHDYLRGDVDVGGVSKRKRFACEYGPTKFGKGPAPNCPRYPSEVKGETCGRPQDGPIVVVFYAYCELGLVLFGRHRRQWRPTLQESLFARQGYDAVFDFDTFYSTWAVLFVVWVGNNWHVMMSGPEEAHSVLAARL